MFLHKMLINPIKRSRLVLGGEGGGHVLNREKINLIQNIQLAYWLQLFVWLSGN